MCATAERFVKCPAVAEDIAQDVIIKYWLSPHKDKIKSPRDYLFIMTKNSSLNYLRSKKRERLRYENIAADSEREAEFFSQLVEEEYNQILIKAIDKLPKPYDRVIRYALSGLTNVEIGFLLDISINTIKFMKANAIKKIKEEILATLK